MNFIFSLLVLSFSLSSALSYAEGLRIIPKSNDPRATDPDAPSPAEIAGMKFQAPLSGCLDQIHAEYRKRDIPDSFFMTGSQLVIAKRDGVYFYSKKGTEIVRGTACSKDSDANDQSAEDGVAYLIETLAKNTGDKVDFTKNCKNINGDRMIAAIRKARQALQLDYLEPKASATKRAN